ncbi:ARM repeat-containing protein [Cystobasidium minutum MCA 4210]|uniref:ARM repeat-containing protein n=1 Tax=Cystobasidium minutum MCA 4210 TaxID=1397322 RepID=UPI0034CE5EF0|eukprot:jgi/Rhomi1/170708/fgenesh1_kg.4_\
MDETGSLLCQAVLENWPDEEKEGIVAGLIKDTVNLCSSQWATFVVLHLIEHGRDEDREAIFKLLLKSSIVISQDQFGAKAIEKMIKVAGLSSDIVKSYVHLICDAGQGRPAVVSICQTANGSQIVTLLLTNAPSELKEMLIEAIRRHGVTLKGSKHGSRIWFVVERARAWRGH